MHALDRLDDVVAAVSSNITMPGADAPRLGERQAVARAGPGRPSRAMRRTWIGTTAAMRSTTRIAAP